MKRFYDITSGALAAIGSCCLILAVVIGYPSVAYAWVPEDCTDCGGDCGDLDPGFVDMCGDHSCSGGTDCADDCLCDKQTISSCDCEH